MLSFRFTLLFGGPSRIGSYTYIKRKRHYFSHGASLQHTVKTTTLRLQPIKGREGRVMLSKGSVI